MKAEFPSMSSEMSWRGMTEVPTYRNVEAAAERLNGVAVQTPLLESALLNEAVGACVLVKAEMLQKTGAFKLRGAWNRLSQLSDDEKSRGVLCYSSGNHAQAVAASAILAGTTATVVMPSTAPIVKLERCRAFGADVVLHQGDRPSMVARATEIAADVGRVLVPPFDDPDIIAGQGTVGLEIAEEMKARDLKPDAVVIPCGGGGLAAGVCIAIHKHFPDAALYGVEPVGFDDTKRSLEAGARVTNYLGAHTLCDALMVPEPGTLTFAINSHLLTRVVTVTDAEVRHAMAAGFEHLKIVAEPGGAAALAAVLAGKLDLAGKTAVVVASGGNVDPAAFAEAIAYQA